MEKVIIEVCPRMQDGQYHACIAGNTAVWDCGCSVETAVARLIATQYEKFQMPFPVAAEAMALSTPSLTSTRSLLSKYMRTIEKVQVEIVFLPTKIR